MGLQLCLGLMLLLGWGGTQDPALSENSTGEEEWPKLDIVKHLPFSCDPKILRSNMSSLSVHTLSPSDVKFVASIGIKGILPFLRAVGIKEKWNRIEETLQDVCLEVGTDIIRFFSSTVLTPVCFPQSEIIPWADTEYTWTQATELVRNMKENEQLDFENDWKLINVFINNAHECYLCPAEGQRSFVTSAMNKLRKTLDYLQREVPRSFVNLVDLTYILDFSALPEMRTHGSKNMKSCRCSEESALYKVNTRLYYQELWESVLASSKYNEKESFALVFQPFFYDPDQITLLEEQELQNPSSLGVHLWNLMEHPYMFTYKNSIFQSRYPLAYSTFKSNKVQLKCPDMTPSWFVPNSVHELKPADIKVIAAVGNSVLAAAGAEFRLQNFNSSMSDHLSLSWSSFNENETLKNILTLPNILRKFNSKLRGYTLEHEMKYSTGARLNHISGDFSMNMSKQVTEVIRKMKNDKKINYKDDWKLLTMFIEGHELCHSCIEKFIFSPENLKKEIQHALDILHQKVPRMVVNVVSPLEITSLRAIYKESRNICPQDQLMKLCPCIMKFDEGSQEYDQVVHYNKKYQRLVRDMVKSGRYDTRDDFTVVLQPFLERFEMPRTEEGLPDLTYFDPDCFHFSQKILGHVASALWNNMLEPVGQKSRMHNFTGKITFACPSQEQPYLKTSKNSIYWEALQCFDMSPSSSSPNSVHSLKPADIKVVGALGDYLTAGRGAGSTPLYFESRLFEFRGLSFSIGGDKELPSVKTLPNILRKFNSNLKGYSSFIGSSTDSISGLNQASGASVSEEFLRQCEGLVTKMKAMGDINYGEDWKLITVMIGYQDFCVFCDNRVKYSPENFIKRVRDGLDYLHTTVPKTLVNVLYAFDPMLKRQVFQTHTKKCLLSYRDSCQCILFPRVGSNDIVELENLTIHYMVELNNLIWSGRYDTRDDFTVVLQPFLQRVIDPVLKDGKSDISFFSEDCLSLSKKGHGKLAYALWNNMLESLESKTSSFDLLQTDDLKCPGDKKSVPFLRTKKNSNYNYPKPIVEQDWGSEFDCEHHEHHGAPPADVASTVHKLKPTDIEVIAAMGDWVTSAWGASPFTYDMPKAWKSLSWSIGGYKVLEKHATLPNILLKFSSVIHGISRGSWPELTGLNVAEEEARARHMPIQANKLLTLMKLNPDINIDHDWKLITIFIGINDLCDFCMNKTRGATHIYIKYMIETLEIFYERLPRVYINLVMVMDVTSFYPTKGKKCGNIPLRCHCFGTMNENTKEKLFETNMKFQRELYKLSFSDEFKTRDDFAVVAQPFFQNSTLPQKQDGSIDDSFLSLNCQYFSALMNNEMALALWNNMLEPVGSKSTAFNFSHSRNKLKCPSKAHPYFYTEKNSVYHWTLWLMVFVIFLLLFLLLILIYVRMFKE